MLAVSAAAPVQKAFSATSTAGFADGRLWLSVHTTTKLGFLAGCQNGLGLAEAILEAAQAVSSDALRFPNREIDDIINELDQFYTVNENGPIPIVAALQYVRHKASGDTTEQLTDLLSILRHGDLAISPQRKLTFDPS